MKEYSQVGPAEGVVQGHRSAGAAAWLVQEGGADEACIGHVPEDDAPGLVLQVYW